MQQKLTLHAYRTLPLLGNAHVQTLLGHWLHGPRLRQPAREHVLWLPDGDGLLLHDIVPPTWSNGQPIALLVHGLTGSHASPQIQRLGLYLLERGLRVVRMDLRGAGKGIPLARGSYHGGRSDDVRAALEEVQRWSPGSPLLLLGVSLGGNIVLKLAGEATERPVPNLLRVASLAAPIDLERCAALLTYARNRIYEKFFIRELLFEVAERHRAFPDLPLPGLPRRLTLRLFDDHYTAPRNNFADAVDYYRKASAFRLIDRITLPALIVTARDDPFIAVEPYKDLRVPDHVSVRILPRGGHLGFLGWEGLRGVRWVERCLAEWLIEPGNVDLGPR
jgi:predicted alpha/beta-fold hydrolase